MTVKGQVTIPKQVRQSLGLKPGDTVDISVARDGVAELRLDADREAYRRAIEDVRRRRPLKLGMSTDEYLALIRDEP